VPTPHEPLARRHVLVLGGLVVLVAALVVVLRLGGDDRTEVGPTSSGPPPPPLVDATWTSPGDLVLADKAQVLGSLSSADQVVLSNGPDLLALDPESGEVLWTLAGGSPCEASPVTADQVALTVRRAGQRGCNVLTLVDLATGRRVWSQSVPAAVNGGFRQLSLSSRVATFFDRCGRTFLRYSRADGRPLAPPQIGAYCEGAGFQRDLFAAPIEGERGNVAIALADPDTGRETARLQGFDGDLGQDVFAIVSAEPLVLDVVRRGHRFLLEVDRQGRPVRALGYQQDDNPNGTHHLVGIHDGVMVVRFEGRSRATYGIDLDSGDVLWTLGDDDSRQTLGVVGGRLLSWYPVGSEIWLTAADVRHGDEPEVLGRLGGSTAPEPGFTFAGLPVDTPIALAGDDVVVAGPGGVRTYPVPEHGDGVDRGDLEAVDALDELEQMAAGPDSPAPAPDPDDISLDDTHGCDDVSPAVFRMLGWGADATLPRPAGCEWVHDRWSPGRLEWSERLSVRLYAVGTAPADLQDTMAAESASERAHAQMTEVMGARRVGLPGVGDEAWLLRGRGYDRRTEVWVRERNLVVRVGLSVSSQRGAPTDAQTDPAVLRALRDVLEPYGITAPTRLPARVPAG
jgi:outer membrane protein assembly factor BamB